MQFTITIPQGLPEMTVKELLEEHFLIPISEWTSVAEQQRVPIDGILYDE